MLIITITAALIAYIFFDSLLLGLKNETRKNAVLYENGLVQLINKNYFEDLRFPVDDTIDFSDEQQRRLREVGWKASPYLQFLGNIVLQSPPFPENGSLPFGITAFDFKRDEFMQNLLADGLIATKNNVDMVRLIDMLDNEDGVLISEWFADKISAEIGYEFSVITKGHGGFAEQLDLEIVGIFKTPNAVFNRSTMIMSYFNANDYLVADAYTGVNLLKSVTANVPNNAQVKAMAQNVQKMVGDFNEHVVAKTWFEVQERYGTMVMDFPQGMALIYTIFILIIAAAGISNSTVMNIMTRNKEIGTMEAFGMSVSEVAWLYTLEMLIVGIVASVIAIVVGLGLMAFLVHVGLDYTNMMKESTFGFSTLVIHGAWDFPVLFKASILGIVFTLVVELIVMSRMKKQYINIVDMLRART